MCNLFDTLREETHLSPETLLAFFPVPTRLHKANTLYAKQDKTPSVFFPAAFLSHAVIVKKSKNNIASVIFSEVEVVEAQRGSSRPDCSGVFFLKSPT